MKVLIIGNYGLVTGNLIARLHREKCDVYVLTGNRRKEKRRGLPKHISFCFQENSADIRYVMQGILPDYVVFTGAWDENYDWSSETCASEYGSSLVNILSCAREYGVRRLCYLSCVDTVNGNTLRGRCVQDGEKSCETYAEEHFQIIALRLPYVYGAPIDAEDEMDLLTEQCFLAKTGEGYCLPSAAVQPLYVTDMADAVYRVAMEENMSQPFQAYEVSGKETVTGNELTRYLSQQYPNLAAAQGSLKLTDTDILDGTAFQEEFGYRPRIDVRTGLERIDVFAEKNRKKIEARLKAREEENKKVKQERIRRQTKEALGGIKNILENAFLFIIAFCAQYYVREEVGAFVYVDFLLLYIILIAMMRSVGQSILAVLLATGGSFYLAWQAGENPFWGMTKYQYVLQFLFYFLIALSISYSFLRSRIRLKEREEQMQELEGEYRRIMDVNKTNVEIKQAFEDRLINYDDSIGKIYNVVSELDVLEVDKIIMSALGVVGKIMSVKDVSIYYAGTEGFFHFVGATAAEAKWQKTFCLKDYEEMEHILLDGDVYINHTVGNDLPRMAAPIFSEGKLIYIIMLWNMEFEELNLYKKNLFRVLVKIITSSLEKGYQYEKVGRSQEYYENTDILMPEAFRSKVEKQIGGRERDELEYTLLQVKAGGMDLIQQNTRIGALLRGSDRMGHWREDEPYLYILIHTSYKDSEFVVRKLQREGFISKVVMPDEI